MRAWPLDRSPHDSRAAAARARRVRCDGLEQKIARLWNTSPPPNAAARQVPPSTLNIFPPGSRCAAASAAVHGAAAALISPRTPPTLASPRPHTTCALLSHPRVCVAARRYRSSRAGPRGSSGAARMQLAAMRAVAAAGGGVGPADGRELRLLPPPACSYVRKCARVDGPAAHGRGRGSYHG